MRQVLNVLLWVGGGYAALCALLYLLQDQLIFFPRTGVGPVVDGAEPLRLERDGHALKGWLVNRQSTGAVLIYFGGNGEELSGLTHTAAKLPASTVLVNYRGYGESQGKPSQGALVGDGKVVFDWARTEFPERPLVIAGRSLGSAVALLTAADRQVAGMVLVSPFRSVAHLAERSYPWLPTRWLLQHPFDTAAATKRLPSAVLVLYATDDSIIPAAESEAFLGTLRTVAPQLRPTVATFRGNHNIPLESPVIWRALTHFLQSIGS